MRTIEELKKERDRIWNDGDMWNDGLEMILDELVKDHFESNYKKAIDFLASLSEEEVDRYSQFFEDFIERMPHPDLLNYMISLSDKYPNIDLKQDIVWAKDAFSNCQKKN